MRLQANIAARIDPRLKQKIDKHVRARRQRGEGISPADVIRSALVEYFDRRDLNGSGALVVGPHTEGKR